MHKIFEIHELIDHIVSHLEDEPGSLARLARVSTRFWESCVKRLWYELKGLDALNALMELEWYPKPSSGDGEHTPSRTETYTSFIRTLSVPIRHLEPDIHTTEERPEITMPKFPVRLTLEKLECAANVMDCFLSPSIKELKIRIPPVLLLSTYKTLFRSLPTKVPDIEKLHLTAVIEIATDAQEPVQRELLRMLVRFPQLRNLNLDVEGDDELISYLGILDLHELTLRMKSEPRPAAASRIALVPFQRLRVLNLDGNGACCLFFMERVTLPLLIRLRVKILVFRAGEISCLCDAIARITHSTLRYLDVSSYSRDYGDGRFPVSSFSPLYRCTQLNELLIASGPSGKDVLRWRGENVVSIAQSCPQLTHLTLIPKIPFPRSVQFHPLIRVQDLFPLADHCPHLSQVRMCVDFESPASMPVRDTNAPQMALRVLELHPYSVPPPDPQCDSVARILTTVWPNIRLRLYRASAKAERLKTFCDLFNSSYARGHDDSVILRCECLIKSRRVNTTLKRVSSPKFSFAQS